MDRVSFDANYHFEQDYWWFLGRRRIVSSLIRRFADLSVKPLALDAGCGTGIVLDDLAAFSRPVGIDRSQVALEYAGTRAGGNNILCGDICAMPFKDNTFDIVTSLGVLYNKGVANDDRAIAEFFRILKKGGIMVIDEAAYKFLQSRHNASVGGVRRYTRRELTVKVEKAGFKVLKASYWDILMLPIFSTAIILDKFFSNNDPVVQLRRVPSLVNWLLSRYIYLESFLMKYISLPFGPSVVLVAKK